MNVVDCGCKWLVRSHSIIYIGFSSMRMSTWPGVCTKNKVTL